MAPPVAQDHVGLKAAENCPSARFRIDRVPGGIDARYSRPIKAINIGKVRIDALTTREMDNAVFVFGESGHEIYKYILGAAL